MGAVRKELELGLNCVNEQPGKQEASLARKHFTASVSYSFRAADILEDLQSPISSLQQLRNLERQVHEDKAGVRDGHD